MKVYKCDACGKIIDEPYKMKMKEFYSFPRCWGIHRVKIHLCDNCYASLHMLAKNYKTNNE